VPESGYVKKCRLKWAAFIKAVYEVDPLKCPKCGGTMKIILFIEDDSTIKKILKHCGKWNEDPFLLTLGHVYLFEPGPA